MNTKFKWFDFGEYRIRSGMVATRINVNESEKLLGVNILREYPPGAGFGKYSQRRIDDADFSPPFLNGHPVTASTTWMVPFDATELKHWVN
jgi:hypothetical protein